MTQLEIKSMSSPDVEIWSDELDLLEKVYYLIQMEVGERGDSRQDLFQVMIVTPEALLTRSSTLAPLLSNRATLVFFKPTWKEVIKEIGGIVESCNAASWGEAVLKLQRYFIWEYEDYVQDE